MLGKRSPICAGSMAVYNMEQQKSYFGQHQEEQL